MLAATSELVPTAEGVSGILPNLDLVNVMVYLCRLEDIPTAFHLQVAISADIIECLTYHLSPSPVGDTTRADC